MYLMLTNNLRTDLLPKIKNYIIRTLCKYNMQTIKRQPVFCWTNKKRWAANDRRLPECLSSTVNTIKRLFYEFHGSEYLILIRLNHNVLVWTINTSLSTYPRWWKFFRCIFPLERNRQKRNKERTLVLGWCIVVVACRWTNR